MKVYALLDENRGGDTHVYLYNKYKDAKKDFDEIVSDIREAIQDHGEIDKDNFNLYKDHLSYDMVDHWGNIKIYSKEFKE